MGIKNASLAMAVLFLAACGYGPITGTVVDTETGKPIEGAIVLVEWTKTEGLPGLTNTKSFKVIEKLTDNDGKFYIEGLSDTSVNKPDMTIYNKGYVAWNNQYIFPGDKKRTDFKWKNGYVFKLERFKPEYSYVEHDSFVGSAIHTGSANEKKALFLKIYREAEGTKIRAELDKRLENGGQK